VALIVPLYEAHKSLSTAAIFRFSARVRRPRVRARRSRPIKILDVFGGGVRAGLGRVRNREGALGGRSGGCPSADLTAEQHTGKFRLGNDQLLVDATGESRISVQDYAIAMIDELERPAHIRQRFTVGY
jgi:hypothetical protein